jgi:hypothetical protein
MQPRTATVLVLVGAAQLIQGALVPVVGHVEMYVKELARNVVDSRIFLELVAVGMGVDPAFRNVETKNVVLTDAVILVERVTRVSNAGQTNALQ